MQIAVPETVVQSNKMNTKNKQYGLILPSKTPTAAVSRSVQNVFAESSDSEEDGSKTSVTDWVKNTLQVKRKQSKLDIDRVLKEDPTVYQYDEVYDDMQKTKMETVLKTKVDRKPKYIQLLKQQAERRKKENERRIERQIQKERDEEGDQFADKEAYVTPSYKKKLEELKKLEEEEKRMDMLEEIGDVTKQRDMTGFYRHLYRTVNLEETEFRPSDNDAAKGVVSKSPPVRAKGKIHTRDASSSSSKDSVESDKEEASVKKHIGRQYRRRAASKSPSPTLSSKDHNTVTEDPHMLHLDTECKKNELSKNPDADTSLSSSSDDEETGANDKKKLTDNPQNPETDIAVEEGKNCENKFEERDEEKRESGDTVKKETKPKRSVWEKRTVGIVFENALQRYFQRKANKLENTVR